MSALVCRMAVRNGLSCSSGTRIGRKMGFTLLEVAIAGAILISGLAILAQLVRTTLSSSTPGFAEGVQVGPVVEQQMKLLGAYAKGFVRGRDSDSNPTAFGAVSVYAEGSTRSYILPLLQGYGGRTYALTEQEITAKLTQSSAFTPSASDPTVGFTRFWKLEVYPFAAERTGL